MKLIRADKEQFVFEIGRREKHLLFEILRLYPLIPVAHQRLSRSNRAVKDNENQRLLEESLAAQRAENRKHVLAMLDGPQSFKEVTSGYRFTLSPPQIEWLLQVLNDVRVGSWLALGSPDTEKGGQIPLNKETAPQVLAMEAAGSFEMVLIEAMSGQMPG